LLGGRLLGGRLLSDRLLGDPLHQAGGLARPGLLNRDFICRGLVSGDLGNGSLTASGLVVELLLVPRHRQRVGRPGRLGAGVVALDLGLPVHLAGSAITEKTLLEDIRPLYIALENIGTA